MSLALIDKLNKFYGLSSYLLLKYLPNDWYHKGQITASKPLSHFFAVETWEAIDKKCIWWITGQLFVLPIGFCHRNDDVTLARVTRVVKRPSRLRYTHKVKFASMFLLTGSCAWGYFRLGRRTQHPARLFVFIRIFLFNALYTPVCFVCVCLVCVVCKPGLPRGFDYCH